MKKYISIIIFLILICYINLSNAAYKKEGIENFPDAYKPYLNELKSKHPNWTFTALYTELDWKYVIDNENKFGVNLVPLSYSDSWKNIAEGEYNVEVDAGWVDASRKSVEYAMDPRNFLNEVRIFQFEGLSYDETTNTLQGIEKILYGTEFYNTTVDYLDSNGNLITMQKKYSDLILLAGQTSRVSSFHLASRIKQEVGPFLTHSSISGTVEGFRGLYNFYNIGATSSAEPMGAIKNGLQYAKDGKGASQATKDKYLIPWNTKERAITGGGIFIGSSYINLGQENVYLQKFHVVDNTNNGLFWHQYMTNVLAPYSESKSIYNGYVNTGLINDSINFIIPVYNNMPTMSTQSPNISDNDYTEDNTKVYADVSSTLNIRTGPSTSYEILTTIDRNVVMTRIAKGKQAGELWDKVQLPNGIIGYAFQNYLKEVPEKQIEEIKLSIDNTIITKGETKKLNIEILPEEAKDHEIIFSSNNNKVATVDSEGNILAIKSGTATITAKAKENNVSATIEIQVYTPVKDMQIDIEKLTLQVGDSFIINPIIFPEDASNKNIIFETNNSSIVNVNNSGNITGIKEGTAKITVKTEEGNISREIEVQVVEKLTQEEISFDESLKIEGNEISGFDIKNLTVSKIKEMINTIYSVEIYNSKGEILEDTKLAGTESIIKILDENNEMKIEYKIIIYGDVNGDGKINSIDLLVLQRHILEIEKLNGLFLKAGNINKNGRNPSSLDSLLIQRHILELKLIEQ